MKQDNRGVTLVELIIGIAILGIVSGVVLGFMASGGRSFKRTASEVNLQFEAQTVINQISDLLISGEQIVINDSGSKLEIYKSDTVDIIEHKVSKNILVYNNGEYDGTSILNRSDAELLAEYVKDFHVKENTDSPIIELDITFALGEREYTANKKITLRSR